jgi:hypothetical protein
VILGKGDGTRKRTIAGRLAFALAVCAIGFSVIRFWQFSSGSLLSDFRGFYCAGRLAAEGVDPYRQEPLYSCEAAQPLPILWHAEGHVTDPAPLPPYSVAMFVPLSQLSLKAASLLWIAILTSAWIAVVVALRVMTGYSWSMLLSCFVFAAMMSISLGQISPIAIAALCISALLVYLKRPQWAGAAAASSMIEPHVALPSCVAMFIAIPRARLPLLTVGITLLLISSRFGIERNIEYMLYVLPAHALSDVPDIGQFSLTVLGHAAGLSDRIASRSGGIWYLIMSTAGIVVACIAGRRLVFLPFIVVLPMAFAVFGGPYVHWQQVVAAIPAALLLLRCDRWPPALLLAAIVGLAIPWVYVVGWGFLIPGAVAIAGTLTWLVVKPSRLTEAFVIAAISCTLLLLNHALPHPSPAPQFVAAVAPNAWADQSWGAYVRARIPIGTGIFFWLHAPTWAALAVTIGFAVRAARLPVPFSSVP